MEKQLSRINTLGRKNERNKVQETATTRSARYKKRGTLSIITQSLIWAYIFGGVMVLVKVNF